MASSNSPPDSASLLTTLQARGLRFVMITAGGGSAAIPALVALPGASAVVLEAIIPSARQATDALLGGPQESYCSSRTARRLAMAAWERCRQHGAEIGAAVGVACTASLATTVPKRGDHRIVVAVQTLGETSVATLGLVKGARSRSEEETIAAAFILARIETIFGSSALAEERFASLLRPGEGMVVDRTPAPGAWQAILAGTSGRVRLAGPDGGLWPAQPGREAIFPGSFDPLHDGHRAMARIGARITGLPVAYELSIRNVEKPALDFLEIAARAESFAGAEAWLTSAPTFVEKLALFPAAPFVVGADTFVRLGNPRYYGGSTDRAAAAVDRIARESGGLIVFGRVRDGQFTEPSRLEVPQALRAIARFVTEEEFRRDISSTSLRQALDPVTE
jgi:nicotinamide mononucleotide (NMN) deamidase PncC